MTKQQVFLILPALAAAYGLGEAEFGEAKAAQEVVKQVRVDVAITGAGAISTFDSYIGSRACPLVDAAKSLSGNDVCNLAEDEADACDQIRRFLSYLPANVWQLPPRIAPDDDPNRRDEALLDFMPRDRRRPHDVRKLINMVMVK